ncbi:hypothetical protein ALC57_05491 [Trachymyrmex cornetzi]|uniref:Uncharacterized protein n=1 Tax=Trachymyrmex cornetzi TaxID=471704 RepID=A0A151JAP5_9HYME|nr:hypothetical protein ALC57_05491 [Trachymyrmex cornetzi]
MRMVEGVKTENQVWEMVNMERKKWTGVNKEIEMIEWEKYFMELLGGEVGRGEGKRDGEREIGREKMEKVMEKLKNGKANRGDGIPNEVWRYEGERN